jgi:hypothetical protein
MDGLLVSTVATGSAGGGLVIWTASGEVEAGGLSVWAWTEALQTNDVITTTAKQARA